MHPLVETLLWIAAISVVLALAAWLTLRWLANRVSQRLAAIAEARLSRTLAAGASKTGFRGRVPSDVDAATRARYLEQIDRLAWLMDRVIPLPIVGGVGLDAVLGLAPVVGDLISLAVSSTIVIRAAQMGAPPELLSRIVAIQCLDLLAGAVPVVGDLIDVGYKADVRSVQLVREWLSSEASNP